MPSPSSLLGVLAQTLAQSTAPDSAAPATHAPDVMTVSDKHPIDDSTALIRAFVVVGITAMGLPVGASLIFIPQLRDAQAALSYGLAIATGAMLALALGALWAESREHFEATKGPLQASAWSLLAVGLGLLGGRALDFVSHALAGEHDCSHEHAHEHADERSESAETHSERPRTASEQISAEGAGDVENQNVSRTFARSQSALLAAEAKASRQLARTTIAIALGLALHSLPEGMITFFTAQREPEMGIAIAAAVFLHHLPAGLAVALPCYAATKSRTRAMAAATAAGSAGPIGALIAWAVLGGQELDNDVVGWLFGATSGVLLVVALHELLPTAIRHDAGKGRVGRCVLVGVLGVSALLAIADATGGHKD